MYVEAGIRQLSLRVYENEGDEAYIAAVQVFIDGEEGTLYSMQGRRFYDAFQLILNICDTFGLSRLRGSVGKAHARLLRLILRNSGWDVILGEDTEVNGHPLRRITVSKRK